jgi:hypothetical protein
MLKRAASICETSLLSNHPKRPALEFCARGASPSMRERRVNAAYDALSTLQVASPPGLLLGQEREVKARFPLLTHSIDSNRADRIAPISSIRSIPFQVENLRRTHARKAFPTQILIFEERQREVRRDAY